MIYAIRIYFSILLLFMLLSLSSCQYIKVDNSDEILSRREQKYKDMGTLFNDDTFVFGGTRKSQENAGNNGIQVNSFLWRAVLDTFSFMPFKMVDPFGGVILTDWYSTPEVPNERIKIDILILSRQLRADGLKISVFQQRYQNNRWVEQSTNSSLTQELEDLVLTRARQLKIKSGK